MQDKDLKVKVTISKPTWKQKMLLLYWNAGIEQLEYTEVVDETVALNKVVEMTVYRELEENV